MDQENQIFHSLTEGDMDLNKVIGFIKKFLEDVPSAKYSLVIGTDSQEKIEDGQKSANLITAIIVHRKGFGGRYFWCKKNIKKIYSLRDKIYAETFSSLDLARIFIPFFQKALNGKNPDYDLEIHIDVGEYGDTRDMIKEVVGIVSGNGFVAKTKPQAYGASYVADKHT